MPNKTIFGPGDLATSHWVKFNTGDNRICYTLTGIFIVNLKGSSQDWLRERIILTIPIPALPSGKGLSVENWAPLFTLSAIYNKDNSLNNGDAIDNFDLNSVPSPNSGETVLSFFADVALRDSDSFIFRIGYNVTLVGTLKPINVIL
jgi:hypothetical protein